MLEVSGITKCYGNKTAVRDISFRVEQGEVVGFLGTNGAGKSTTMNIITGYLSATSGTVTVEGFDVLSEPVKAKARIGYLPEVPPLYQDMTVWESLCFAYDLKKVRLNKKEHLEELCGLVRISDVKDRLIRNLSKGYRQRVGIACALAGNPPILILDEPTVGLDPKQIIEIRSLIEDLAKTRTVILSSHILQEIQAVCGRVIIINHGVIVADDTPENLIAGYEGNRHLTVAVKGDAARVKKALETVPGVLRAEPGETYGDGRRYSLDTGGADVREALFYALAEERLPLLELRDGRATLEEVFLRLTRETAVEPAEPESPEVPVETEEAEETEGGVTGGGDL